MNVFNLLNNPRSKHISVILSHVRKQSKTVKEFNMESDEPPASRQNTFF